MLLLPPVGAQLGARDRVCSIGTAGALFDDEITLERVGTIPKIIMMIGLRIYISPSAPAAVNGGDQFYSRRSDGPYYRWWYEETHWRSARMHLSDFSPGQLSASAWKTVPPDLQRSLGEHYQD